MYCQKCGKQLGDEDSFCPNCGEKVRFDRTNSSPPEKNELSTQKEPIGFIGLFGAILVLVGMLCPFVDTWYYTGSLFDIVFSSLRQYVGDWIILLFVGFVFFYLFSTVLYACRVSGPACIISVGAILVHFLMTLTELGIHATMDEVGTGFWITTVGLILMLLSPTGNLIYKYLKK